MKNIHILPTDKPSKLHYNEIDELVFTPKSEQLDGINIYITSDEEIKENDYIITKDGRLVQVYYLLSKDIYSASKVTLSTDQDLIKDGVQTIDDEFLEWFVKNPSCEEVEVLDEKYDISTLTSDVKKYPNLDVSYYKITIPKEEVKKETLEEANELKYYFENDIIMLECINQMASTGHLPTRWSWFLAKISELYKQQERMYSEEEVHNILDSNDSQDWSSENNLDYWEWFEQFKKK